MMLWISSISGLPGSIPTSFSTGIRRSPNASNCSRESQISLTRNLPSDLKATWYSSPSGSQSPDFSSRWMLSSYCSVVTWDVGVKRARMLVLRASMTGAADELVVAIDGLLRVDAPDRADLQPSTSYRVAWRARILSQKALRNLSAFSTARAFSSQQSRAPHDACSRVHRRDQPEARLRDPRPRPALLTDTANKRWSLYGAPWVQPVAIS